MSLYRTVIFSNQLYYEELYKCLTLQNLSGAISYFIPPKKMTPKQIAEAWKCLLDFTRHSDYIYCTNDYNLIKHIKVDWCKHRYGNGPIYFSGDNGRVDVTFEQRGLIKGMLEKDFPNKTTVIDFDDWL
jgi:hypothetical protein